MGERLSDIPRPSASDRERLLKGIEQHFSLSSRETGVERCAPEVLDAIGQVARHVFLPQHLVMEAYTDAALPIGYGQTISQPFIVALMTHLLAPRPQDRVLEIGTGSGYQTAVLAEMCDEVYTVERLAMLLPIAQERLVRLGYHNIHFHVADGHEGWSEQAPFDRIIVTAGASWVPEMLLRQLNPGGRLVIPVASSLGYQTLHLLEKDEEGDITDRDILPVAFVPLLDGIQSNDIS